MKLFFKPKDEVELKESVNDILGSIELNIKRIREMMDQRGNYSGKPIQWNKVSRRLFGIGRYGNNESRDISERILESFLDRKGGE